jgi:hypothetical protein
MRALLSCSSSFALACRAQTTPAHGPGFPEEYEIGGITVSGTLSTDPNAVKLFTGLQVGDKITVPGDRITGHREPVGATALQRRAHRGRRGTRVGPCSCTSSWRRSPGCPLQVRRCHPQRSDKLRDEIRPGGGSTGERGAAGQHPFQVPLLLRGEGLPEGQVTRDQREERPDTLRGNSVLLIIEVDKGP